MYYILRECYTNCEKKIYISYFPKWIKVRKEENKKIIVKRKIKVLLYEISVGEIRKYQSIALNGESGRKGLK